MALTVVDCLKIGLLRNATVIAGHSGLNRTVESVSVFEFNGFLQENLSVGILKGHELTLSALSWFIEHKDENLRFFAKQLFRSGISCLIIFYLGMVLEQIPPELIECANEESVPLIIMPPLARYSYADVIMSVSEAIISERRPDTMFVGEILQRFSDTNEQEQNMQLLLDLLSEQVGMDLILADDMLIPFITAMSRHASLDPIELLRSANERLKYQIPLTPFSMVMEGVSCELRFHPVRTKKLIGILIAVQPQYDVFDIDALTQATEVLRLIFGIWRVSHSRLNELSSWLEGGRSGIGKGQYTKLLVVRGEDGSSLTEKINDIRLSKTIARFSDENIALNMVFYDGSIVIAWHDGNGEVKSILERIQVQLNISACMGVCDIVRGQSVNSIFLNCVNMIPPASKIFDGINIYFPNHLDFARDMQYLYRSLGSNIEPALKVLEPLRKSKSYSKNIETLKTLLIDCQGNKAAASKKLNLHINTLKYRVSQIEAQLGVNLCLPTDMNRLVTALALACLMP